MSDNILSKLASELQQLEDMFVKVAEEDSSSEDGLSAEVKLNIGGKLNDLAEHAKDLAEAAEKMEADVEHENKLPDVKKLREDFIDKMVKLVDDIEEEVKDSEE